MSASLARPVVLIVDDVPDVRLGYRMLLEADNCEVLEASDAPTALAFLERRKVDVLLADLYMPGRMDGVDLIQRLTTAPPPRPAIIAMSGAPHLAYHSSLNAARYVGADATLIKPVSRIELIETVRSLMVDRAPPPGTPSAGH